MAKSKKPDCHKLTFPLPFVVMVKNQVPGKQSTVLATFVYHTHAAYFAREIGGQVYKWAEDGCSLLPVG